MEQKTKIGIGIGVAVVGIGTTIFVLRRKKKNEQEQEPAEVPGAGNAKPVALMAKVNLPGFVNFYGGKEYLSNMVRGVRNNNPGNIRRTAIKWQYKVPNEKATDKSFEQFYTYKGGLRAMILNLKSYRKKGYRTIRQIINRWSPPSENKTEQYIKHVSEYTGFPEGMPIVWDKRNIQKIVEAIIISENGKLYLNQFDFDWAWINAN